MKHRIHVLIDIGSHQIEVLLLFRLFYDSYPLSRKAEPHLHP